MIITPPWCGPCGRQHDPSTTCLAEAALSVFTPARAEHQDAVDHLEAVTVTCYRFHSPRRQGNPRHPDLIALMVRAHRGVASPDHPTPFAVVAAATVATVAAVLALIALVSVPLH